MVGSDRRTEDEGAAPIAAPSVLSVALRARCPRCGEGELFRGFLQTRPNCPSCGLDYRFVDSGDGPAFFIMSIVGALIVAGALITEVTVQPPYWVHLSIWLPLILILSFGLMRPTKALMIALQYRHKAEEVRFPTHGGPGGE
ncbi:DUF983 domain-containing protein [Lutibaculum baratangense]|uniref:Putative cyt c oxidase n=1 Tax=Lutibaculum baratangense AMV1 TaxID=631454 RepID=V4RHY7_9HYPH|nr:DUF983 domain-containing protein [Lutibaculum baratangense]ESR24934.1 putative cyt c oxidase [Lutibaculum baratangense AMV1]